jgi:predicted RNA-binding Zn ribbon-like protein
MRVFEDAPFPRRGGPPPVDLVNTEIVVRGKPGDLLADEAAVAAWFRFERERLDLDERTLSPAVEDTHRLRTTLREAFTTIVAGDRLAQAALDQINAAARREPVELALEWDAGPRVRARSPGGGRPADALGAVGRSAVTFLAGPDRGRLRACGNPGCILFFIAGNRRQQWCSEACGRRVRVARHERRRRAAD